MNGNIQLNALDHYFADFIRGLDSAPCDELWLAAALASSANCQGSVCLDITANAERDVVPFMPSAELLRTPDAEQWFAALSACSTVGEPGDYTPLLLDRSGRLYLYRSWDYEQRAADSIISRVSDTSADLGCAAALLEKLFPPTGSSPDWQRVAAVAAMSKRFTVISGGPGTGKTSTVARILTLLLEQAGEHDLRIALAAPTGKAASRLRESILKSIRQLELDESVRARIPIAVQTIHRLLGVIPDSPYFRHNRDNPLTCDVLVVDEVSMVDLPLMSKLLDALRDDCRVILLGDQDQLASVEAGAVLADICNHGIKTSFSKHFTNIIEKYCGPFPAGLDGEQAPDAVSPISDAVIGLSRSYRFGGDSGIGNLSRIVNSGDSAAAVAMLVSGNNADLVWKPLPVGAAFQAEFRSAVLAGYGDYISAVTAEQALLSLDEFRVLSPYREGQCGVENLNRLALASLGLRKPDGDAICNRMPVMVTGNNYELGLFNGDTAVLMTNGDERGLTAYFSDPEAGVRSLSALRLPPFEPAFALTVHKCQGSEFDRILLILPAMDSEILTRELIYTAITRAKSRVEVWCNEDVFCRAVDRRITRSSGLRDRLWGEKG